MIRIIRGKLLLYWGSTHDPGGGDVYRHSCSPITPLGHIQNMPKGLSKEEFMEWGRIADFVEADVKELLGLLKLGEAIKREQRRRRRKS